METYLLAVFPCGLSMCLSGPQPLKRLQSIWFLEYALFVQSFLCRWTFRLFVVIFAIADSASLFFFLMLHIFVHKYKSACRKFLKIVLLVWACLFHILIGTTILPHEAQVTSTKWKVFHDQIMNLNQCFLIECSSSSPPGIIPFINGTFSAGLWSTSKQNRKKKHNPVFYKSLSLYFLMILQVSRCSLDLRHLLVCSRKVASWTSMVRNLVFLFAF